MRILRTADWHIGQTVNGWTREFEHRAFLKMLADIIEAQAIDALIVAGDVFDGINPSAEATQLLYGGLEVSDARRLKALEDENAKLKKLLAEAMLDNAMLKDVASKKW